LFYDKSGFGQSCQCVTNMEYIDYSKNWADIAQMSVEELSRLDLEKLDEEDLDAVSIRLKKLGEKQRVLSVYDVMLKSDRTNPGVEYTNIYEELIIVRMAERKFQKAIKLLESYLIWDRKERYGYRNHFIRGNLGVCHILEGREEQGEKVLAELIYEAPGDLWIYHDAALDFYFGGRKDLCVRYLRMGADRAKRDSADNWYKLFTEKISELEAGL